MDLHLLNHLKCSRRKQLKHPSTWVTSTHLPIIFRYRR